MMVLRKNARDVLRVLRDGGPTTVSAIAAKVQRSVNGVSQTIGTLEAARWVKNLGGKGGDRTYQFSPTPPAEFF